VLPNDMTTFGYADIEKYKYKSKREVKPEVTTAAPPREPILPFEVDWEFKTVHSPEGLAFTICPKCNCWTARPKINELCDHNLSTPRSFALMKALDPTQVPRKVKA